MVTKKEKLLDGWKQKSEEQYAHLSTSTQGNGANELWCTILYHLQTEMVSGTHPWCIRTPEKKREGTEKGHTERNRKEKQKKKKKLKKRKKRKNLA